VSSFARVAAEAAGRADWQAIPADRSVWLLTVAVTADVEAGNDHQSQHDRRGHQAGDRQPGPDRRGDAADRHRGPAHEQTRQGTHATLSAAHDGTAQAVLNQPHGMRITLTLPGATS
jgi:hypothetical protein